ncbi:galactose mutarotase-like isoform X2 [Leptidea sinapis]|uniref:galactose mutarotase-like isoform X2 n=1 Tax=Leptidea sinapis TaxID=189913 RepID=UPI002124A26C|nr:galactose mutarotase-like isoform X2 [Leptidea sinapis]
MSLLAAAGLWMVEGGDGWLMRHARERALLVVVPDRDGNISDVVLGFDDLDSYVNRNVKNFGGVIGRCTNRIAEGTFQIDGVTHRLTKNRDGHHVHGGNLAFDKVNWSSSVDGNKVIFSRLSKDGEEGYPGELLTNIIYEVRDDNTWCIEYLASTTAKTIVNLTNHSYFNLAGHETGAEELYNHIVAMNCDKILEVRSDWIPTGRLLPVAGSAFDLRTPRRLGDIIEDSDILFHHNFCVSRSGNNGLNFISRVTHPATGRYLDVYSDQPSLLFYNANFFPKRDEPGLPGKDGAMYRRHAGMCLEAQNYVDAVHHPMFPTVILKPGDIYKQKTEYRFGVLNGFGIISPA